MVFADASGSDRNQLASVKAVAPGYPLRGVARIATEPFVRGEPTPDVPGIGEVWMDSRLFPSLGVEVGDRVAVGTRTSPSPRCLPGNRIAAAQAS